MEIYHHIYSPTIIRYSWVTIFIFLFYFVILMICIIFKYEEITFVERGITYVNGRMEEYLICEPPKIYTSIIIGCVLIYILFFYFLGCCCFYCLLSNLYGL